MNFAWNDRLPRSIQESFTCRKSTTWDQRLYFPSEGRRAEDFFALKNPTASAGFEPANGCHVRSVPSVSLNCQHEHFELQEARVVKLLRFLALFGVIPYCACDHCFRHPSIFNHEIFKPGSLSFIRWQGKVRNSAAWSSGYWIQIVTLFPQGAWWSKWGKVRFHPVAGHTVPGGK